MLLYHGTSQRNLDTVLRDGLKPRAVHGGRSHYKAASHADAVYLTDAYAPYFAFNTKDKIDAGCVVFVIDTTRLEIGNLAPDEDALEQANRVLHFARNVRGDMAQRTRHFLRRHFEYAAMGYNWLWSLRTLGTCCYHGTIPPNTIVKTVEWSDYDTIMQIAIGVFDPLITIANYRFCGAEYRYLMQEMAQVDTSHSEPPMHPGRMSAIRELFTRITVRDNPSYK